MKLIFKINNNYYCNYLLKIKTKIQKNNTKIFVINNSNYIFNFVLPNLLKLLVITAFTASLYVVLNLFIISEATI